MTTPPVYEELAELALAGRGWPAILSRLKSLLETGKPLTITMNAGAAPKAKE